MPARVASAEETRECERATIESGVASRELMKRAGYGAAAIISSRYQRAATSGVMVFAGPGNNGGDGWIVASSLAKSGIAVSVAEIGAPRSAESIAARADAVDDAKVRIVASAHGEQLVVDALLGTGGSGSPRGEIADAVRAIETMREAGATIVSLDVPSGLDATTGEYSLCVRARATVSFGVLKRGHLIARDVCGELTVVDIGLLSEGAIETAVLLQPRQGEVAVI